MRGRFSVDRRSPSLLLYGTLSLFRTMPVVGIDTICFFFQHIMLFIMLFFCSNYAKNMLFARHYAKLF